MLQDVRYALRTFARRPSFVIAAVATLALGIAVNTIAFSVINALLLRPLPVPEAGRVFRVYPLDDQARRGNAFSYPDYLDYQRAGGMFETLAAYSPAEVTSGRSSLDREPAPPRPALAYLVSANYFALTGVRVSLGRLLREDDRDHVVVLSHGFWRARLAADPAAVGSTIVLNGTPFTVVGVAAPGFAGTEPLVADCWIPLETLAITGTRAPLERDAPAFMIAGRLTRGVAAASAAQQLSLHASRLAAAYPGRSRPAAVDVVPATFFTVDPALKPIIGVVMSVVGLVLLIACANATNLALARVASRRREIALRLALGAGRGRIVRQLLAESLLVGLAAGVTALLVSQWTLRLLYRTAVSLAALPWAVALNLEPDIRIYAWTSGIALLSGTALGLLPALQAASPRVAGALHGESWLGGRIRGAALRHALVVAQVAASLVLLFGAALLLRGVRSAETLDVGFASRGVLYGEFDLHGARYSRERAAAFTGEIVEAAAALPGVRAVALTSHVPLHGGVRWVPVRLVERDGTLAEPHAIVTAVSPDYFDVLRIPVVAGRPFTSADAAVPAVVISEGLARRFWPGEPALGKVLSVADSPMPRTVVGVVRDAANGAIWRDKELSIYLPIDASTDPRDLQFILRAEGDPAAVRRALEQRAAAIAADLRFSAVPLDDLLRLWRLPSKIAAAGISLLGVMALAMACVGLYGVLTFAVGERARELGIRMALGADARSVVALILRDAGRLVLVGLAIGTGCALPAAPLLGSLLFGVSPVDPIALAAAAFVLAAVSLAAAYVPARRAARLEPLTVLRTH